MWVVDQPAVQAERLIGPVFTRVDLAAEPVLVEAFADPRITRGTYREKVGHSYGVGESGIVYVSVPFTDVRELSDVRIRVIDTSKAGSFAGDPASVAAFFDSPPEPSPIVGDIGATALRKHPDWLKVATALALPAKAGCLEIYLDHEGRYRWRLRRASGEIVADGAGPFLTREACEADIAWVRAHAASIEVLGLDSNGGTSGP
jgi:uncharacterized protein YegP (UPF0339 family)